MRCCHIATFVVMITKLFAVAPLRTKITISLCACKVCRFSIYASQVATGWEERRATQLGSVAQKLQAMIACINKNYKGLQIFFCAVAI